MDMKFAASDSLSELVWSQQEGLSLKSADCSDGEKKPVILWNVGPSNLALSPSQSVGCSDTDKKQIGEGNFVLSCSDSYVDRKVALGAVLAHYEDTARQMIGSSHKRSTENNPKMDEENNKEGDFPSQNGQIDENLGDIEEKEVCSTVNLQEAGHRDRILTLQGSEEPNIEIARDWILSLQGSEEPNIEIAKLGKLNRGNSSNAIDKHKEANGSSQFLDAVCNNQHDREVALPVKELSKEKMKLSGLNTLEFSAENDLDHLINRVNFLPGKEERLPRGRSVPLETSPVFGSQWKGKKKAASDGNLRGRFDNASQDGYGSEESCNSVGFFHKGKRKCEFQENLMAESKRIKKQIDGISASTSVIQCDSSFMNWIRNVVKGCSKTNHEGAPPLDLSLGHSNNEYGCSTHSKTHDSTKRNIGFQNVFQSLYASNSKLLEARPVKDGSEEPACSDKVNPPNSPELCMAISCGTLNKVSDRCILQSSTDVAGQLSHIDSAANRRGANLGENKATCFLNSCDGMAGKTCSDSLDRHKMTAVESQTPELAGEGGDMFHMSNKSNLISSLWITRLSSKVSSQAGCSSLSLDHRKRTISGVHLLPELDFSAKAKCLDAQENSNKDTSGDSFCEELQLIAAKNEYCVGIKDIYECNHQNIVNKIRSIYAGNLRKLEAIAFMFPRRLDALKHIVLSVSKDNETCFFCGKRVQSIPCCSLVNETQQNCSQGHDNLYNGPEDTYNGLPVPCTRCFQLDHGAVSCPVGSSGQKLFKKKEMHCFRENVDCPQGFHFCSSKTCLEDDCGNRWTDEKEFLALGGPSSTRTEKQQMDSDKHSLVLRYLPGHSVTDAQVGGLPSEIFNAVRRLQMSRTDIVKLMNSCILLSRIEGFFLRLRLAEWEAGLGGTGYHVACITVQAGKSVEDGDKSLYVDVGGIKCPVGTQYVSNHEFLEEELMTWWCRTMTTGGKIPSKDDLALKLEQRIKLGI